MLHASGGRGGGRRDLPARHLLELLATGLIFTCSGLFQALGNTWPSLLSSGSRLLTFVLPAVWLSQLPHFTLMQVWYLSVANGDAAGG